MFRELTVCVVVPAFDEAPRIAATIAGLPAFVDRIVVVDDGSADGTADAARRSGDARLFVVRHPVNMGVGRAIATGYADALRAGSDVTVVVGADGQMDPREMDAVITPVALGRADYAKGNRLLRPGWWRRVPAVRLAGILVLSCATRLATGYGGMGDSQCGYTAVSRAVLERLPLDAVYARYGYPNDLLVRLAGIGARVADVPVAPLYGVGEVSKLRVRDVVLPISRILAAGLAARVGRAVRRAPRTRGAPHRAAVSPGAR